MWIRGKKESWMTLIDEQFRPVGFSTIPRASGNLQKKTEHRPQTKGVIGILCPLISAHERGRISKASHSLPFYIIIKQGIVKLPFPRKTGETPGRAFFRLLKETKIPCGQVRNLRGMISAKKIFYFFCNETAVRSSNR